MRYLPNTPEQQRQMLEAIGVASVDELLGSIPPEVRLSSPLDVPTALAESDLMKRLRELAARNASVWDYTCFLGGGAYDHAIPSPIDHLISRGEFFTAYTPYQPEASQGTLRAIFEYQTLMAELTGMDVANASLYDGASALAEGVLTAHTATGRLRVALSGGLNPLYRKTLDTYLRGTGVLVETVPLGDGETSLEALRRAVSESTAALVVQHPNFFGCLEDVGAAAEIAHAAGALLVVSCDPVNLGLLRPPGAFGADVVVGEGQGLGVPLSFGGPYLGVMATRKDLVRRMPGRLVGETADVEGRRGYVLTLQTREQHIRREKATSNICTNVALCSLMATIYCSLLGREGLRKVGELSTAKAHYAAEALTRVPGVRLRFGAPFFKEFVLELPVPADEVTERLLEKKILGGVPLGRFDRVLGNCLLVAVTEKRTREEIDELAAAVREILA